MLAYLTLALAYLVFVFWKDYTGYYLSAAVFGIAAFSIPTIMAAAAGDAVGGRLAPAGLGFITALLRHRTGAWTVDRGLYQGRDGHVHICLPPIADGFPRRCLWLARS